MLFINMLSYNVILWVILAVCLCYILTQTIPYPKLQLFSKLLVIPAILACVFLLGTVYVNENFKQKTHALIAKVQKAEQQAQLANQQLNEKSKQQVKRTKVKTQKVIEYIDREVKILDHTCKIPEPFIQAHNMAVEK